VTLGPEAASPGPDIPVPSATPPLAKAPPAAAAIFTYAPGGGKYDAPLALMALALIAGITIALGIVTSNALLAIIAGIVMLVATPIGYRAFMDRYPLLRVSKDAIVRRGGIEPDRKIPWREITRIGPADKQGREIKSIGPVDQQGRAYLYAWLKKGNERVWLCPLEPRCFPAKEIRAAILARCPTANVDPM
jgi:hypothetical protein